VTSTVDASTVQQDLATAVNKVLQDAGSDIAVPACTQSTDSIPVCTATFSASDGFSFGGPCNVNSAVKKICPFSDITVGSSRRQLKGGRQLAGVTVSGTSNAGSGMSAKAMNLAVSNSLKNGMGSLQGASGFTGETCGTSCQCGAQGTCPSAWGNDASGGSGGSGDDGLGAGAIAGVAVTIVFAVAGVGFAAFKIKKHRVNSSKRNDAGAADMVTQGATESAVAGDAPNKL